MNLYYNKNFHGHCPVGTAAIVTAENEIQAAEMLEEELEKVGLKQKVNPSDMVYVSTTFHNVVILNNGDY